MSISIKHSKKELRRTLISKRAAISHANSKLYACRAIKELLRTHSFQQSQRIAFYWPYQDEFNVLPCLYAAIKEGKHCFLPVTEKNNRLSFKRFNNKLLIRPHQYNILAPVYGRKVNVQQLDLIIVPLLGFDKRGNRLGMGGGYYDRFLKTRKRQPKPSTIGIAYRTQEIQQVPTEQWDMRLDMLLINGRLYRR